MAQAAQRTSEIIRAGHGMNAPGHSKGIREHWRRECRYAGHGMEWMHQDTQGAFESTRAGDGLDILATQRASESTGLGSAPVQGRAWHGVQALGCTEDIREH